MMQSAAIVCGEVAVEGAPILFASRSSVEDEDDADSGWQFLCGGTNHEEAGNAQIWALHEVLSKEPSLIPYIEMPPGTWLSRDSPKHKWEIHQRPDMD